MQLISTSYLTINKNNENKLFTENPNRLHADIIYIGISTREMDENNICSKNILTRCHQAESIESCRCL